MEMRLHYIEKRKPLWHKAKWLSEVTSEEYEKANLRTMFPHEIIFDCESAEEKDVVIKGLQDAGFGYQIWSTGSRGYHIRLLFPEMWGMNIASRNYIRKQMIERFGGDPAKASERTWIAAENRQHFKTGKLKTLIDSSEGCNIIPAWIKFKPKTAFQPSNTPTSLDSDPVLRFVMENKIPDGTGRYSCLLKNIGILLGTSKLSESELEHYVSKIISNCPGRKPSDLWGWIRAAQSGRFTEYNRGELIAWFEKHMGVLA